MGTSVATSFHIAGFSALRFLSIVKPHLFRRITLAHARVSTVKSSSQKTSLLRYMK